MLTFSDFSLPAEVLRELTRQGLTSPFPIQQASLPDTLAGKDVLGRGRTGSGKTLAFSLPIVTRLIEGVALRSGAGAAGRRSSRPRALVLCPTRELANQINATIEPLAKAVGLNTTTIFGGVAQSRQVSALRAGVDIVIACPGRLEDLLGQRALTLDGIEITVLDEADHMADLGFLPGVKRIMDRTPRRGQRMLFSATLDNGVDQLVKRYLHNPVTHSVDSAESPVTAMEHHIFTVRDAAEKKELVQELASGVNRRVLFTRTKHQAKKLAKQLTAAGIPAVDLHGNLSQNARERNLEAFSSGTTKVLVATDIAARGIHVDEVDLVVHVDPPAEHKAYLHRSGRTARAGHGGSVVTLVLPEQRDDVRSLTRAAKISAKPVAVAPGDRVVTDLVGERAAYVAPTAPSAAVPAARKPGSTGGGRGGSRGGVAGRGAAGGSGGRGQRRGGAGGSERLDQRAGGSDQRRGGAPARSGGSRGRGARPNAARSR
ncbi:DEAD/DEAH box helicase [Rarobacter faecitabidus]|uniref:DEAD/DEAH box helicase n=1 Tax=Rarobacter faecitabidus TaxID=13243 RepID=UPI001153BADD|nr:DEAD/DEAH box helicase [Rarobacter faecitabidus]